MSELAVTASADCLFCKIVGGAIPVERLFDDDKVLAFADINPQAPTHLLVIPKQHVSSLAETVQEHASLLGHLIFAATHVAAQQKLGNGYRLVINTGAEGGQTVQHLHVHLLGGRPMLWPPG